MTKTLDFNKLKKQYMTVTLPDEEQTVLMISTPTKAVMDQFIAMQNELSAEAMGDNAINELYELCAKIMNRNKMGIPISVEKVQEVFDFEDIVIFIRAYTEFIGEVNAAKN